MYQFDRKAEAVEWARLLAVHTACPVLVMFNALTNRYTAGLRTSIGVRQAGAHIATVHRSGLVEEGHCLKGNWMQHRLLRNRCLCE